MIEKINIREKFNAFYDYWHPRLVGELNGQQVKLTKFQGEFIWHHQEYEDELFMVIKGCLLMKLRDKEVWVEAGEMTIIPAKVEGTYKKKTGSNLAWNKTGKIVISLMPIFTRI
ncbi:mannose-6-phosphate isomerase [Candidatus Protochlamydia naegleriophila]|uniref:Mannose-6-phosphate isomerase n=1 Tax=Candidatus Protochlamydia naegleriophila TaxID=389348 RepID=A0A0U5JE37_9BACT|nr:cupin domain-containing protein [Candidatus Protochlamydia naegleriophila]CUI17415.1 mannose-6-phosphate isomerase [Candidatus Protochlamydia naegleriophila]